MQDSVPAGGSSVTSANTAQSEGPSASRQAASLEFHEATKRYP
jgi:hypothetical protein